MGTPSKAFLNLSSLEEFEYWRGWGDLGHLSTREQYCGGGGWEFFGYWWEFFKLYEH